MYFKTRFLIPVAIIFSFMSFPLLSADLTNIAPMGIATQSSDLSATYPAQLAIDGDLTNFTHTASAQVDPWWEVELADQFDISTIVIHNRTSCCGSRLRDITVSIYDEKDGDVIYESDLLNEENSDFFFPNGPDSLTIDLVGETGDTVKGQIVRITRTSDPDLSGTGGQGNGDEANVLSLGEVEIFAAISSEVPFFITSPKNGRVYVGQNYELVSEATVGSGDISYQWFKDGIEIPGATEATYLLDFVEMDNAGEYTVTATANGNSITSNPAELEVPGVNLSLWGTATQSSDYNTTFIASLAIDGNINNYTHTAVGQTDPWWQIDLNGLKDIEKIILWNRVDCCGSRLRDITVKILDDIDGDVIYESDLLNEANEGFVFPLGPEQITINLVEETGNPVKGRIVRIERISDPGLVGTDGQGNTAEPDVLSLAEVEIFSSSTLECPADGDTHIEDMSYEGPLDNLAGDYVITTFGSDDSDDSPLLYTFTAEKQNSEMPILTTGLQTEDSTVFNLSPGKWIITGTIDDDPICRDTAADATKTMEIEVVGDPDNLAWIGTVTQSTTCYNSPADNAIDTNIATFSHTCPNDDGAWWEADLGETADIDLITLQNRPGFLSRLRDITITILDKDRNVVYESDLLNEENEGFVFPDGPLELTVNLVDETGGSVKGQIVHVERLPDPDLSGTAGGGNIDEANILTLVEVIIQGSTTGQTQEPLFRRGDSNGDKAINLADAITILSYLFSGAAAPTCLDSADTNDDGSINLADAIQLLSHLFAGSGDLPQPFPNCGEDPTPDDKLAECNYPNCP